MKMPPPPPGWIPGVENWKEVFLCEHNLMGQPPEEPNVWSTYRHPMLRKCRFDKKDIKWTGFIGYGREGCVFQARFGDGGPFAVKVVRILTSLRNLTRETTIS